MLNNIVLTITFIMIVIAIIAIVIKKNYFVSGLASLIISIVFTLDFFLLRTEFSINLISIPVLLAMIGIFFILKSQLKL
ncbi:hypothetical protein NH13_04485 [Lactobacillus acidophilus]|nr:hypothetical protein NH13_04485 [Lactobacillus acidophilus]